MYGFEPSIGFLHKPFRSHFALASDILELLRAKINEEVYRLFAEHIVKKEEFTKRGEGVYLRFQARQALWKVFHAFYTDSEVEIENAITMVRKML